MVSSGLRRLTHKELQMEMRICSQCKRKLPVDQFFRDSSKPANGGRHYNCKKCKQAAVNKWRAKNPEKDATYKQVNRFRKAGVTTDYNEMAALRERRAGLCESCDNKERVIQHKSKKILSVDHDHVTGKLRGLVCSDCNHGIGAFMDDPNRMLRAIIYLMKHGKRVDVELLEQLQELCNAQNNVGTYPYCESEVGCG